MKTEPKPSFPKPYADSVQRLRVASGFALLIAFAWFAGATPLSAALGLPVSLVGLFIRAWAAGHLDKNRELATSGPYGYVRNPLYVGTLLAAAGLVIASRSLVLTVLFLGVFLLVYLPVIELEEQHLRKLFLFYDAYAARVGRLWPKGRWPASAGSFSWRLYLQNQEYKAALGFLVAVAWLVWRYALALRHPK